MAASQCVHDGRTEIANDESPRSPDQKRDQEKSEPKRDAAPYTWYRPEAAKRQDRKSKATAAHNILENISHLPLMLRHDRRARRFDRRVNPCGMHHGEEPSFRASLDRR